MAERRRQQVQPTGDDEISVAEAVVNGTAAACMIILRFRFLLWLLMMFLLYGPVPTAVTAATFPPLRIMVG